jgi:CheY-like chemotaxis protein
MKQPVRILVVEDEAITALALELGLTDAGYAVCKKVVTGEEAITSAKQEHPDVILMDIRLAGEIDGIEAAQQIRASASIPIIFMTGYPEKNLAERAEQVNPLGYFIKPINLHDLKPIIDSVLRERDNAL